MTPEELAALIRERLDRYFTNDPFDGKPNKDFRESDNACDAIDDIVEIIRPYVS